MRRLIMTKWEYLVVVPQLAGETIRPRFVDGKELEDWEEGPGLPEFLDQQGEQGWELASVSGSVLYFKRPKA
jgi:hypothetical protein